MGAAGDQRRAASMAAAQPVNAKPVVFRQQLHFARWRIMRHFPAV
jgi:hypothetical protein